MFKNAWILKRLNYYREFSKAFLKLLMAPVQFVRINVGPKDKSAGAIDSIIKDLEKYI